MEEAREFDHGHGDPDATLELPFELRQKCRLRARLSSGQEIALFLPRGTVLRHGARLHTTMGRVVQVLAAPETVSVAATGDLHLLTRIAYHLGNRHVPLQVEPGRLAYQHDHVLDDMVEQLGVQVTVEQAPFEPEAGAYGGHSHAQGHDHGHSHAHASSHSEAHARADARASEAFEPRGRGRTRDQHG